MATLVRIAAHLRAVLAAHVPFQFVNRRRLRSPHDVEGNRLMRVAAETTNLKIAVSRVKRVAQRRRWLRWTLERQHPLVRRFAGQAVGLLASLCSARSRRPNRCAVDGLA